MRVSKLRTYLYYFLILVYMSGAVGCFIKPGFFLPFTPLALLLTLACFLLYQPVFKATYIFSFGLLALSGFLLEVAGVKTGLVFGEYTYGASLGIKFFGVPLLISANWALLINCGIVISGRISDKPVQAAFFSALIVTLTDVLIEQVACSLNYWCFAGGQAGWHNYTGWFIFSFAASYLLRNPLYTQQLKIAATILILQLIYFSAINLSVFYNFI